MNEKRVFYLLAGLLLAVAGLWSSYIGRINEKDKAIQTLRAQLTLAIRTSHQIDHVVRVPVVVRVQGQDRLVYQVVHDRLQDTASVSLAMTTTALAQVTTEVTRPGAPMWAMGAGAYRVPDIRGQSWTGPYARCGVNIGLLTVEGIGLTLPDSKFGYGGGVSVRF